MADPQEQGVDPVVEQAREVVFAAVDDLRTDPLSPWETTIVAVRALRDAGLLSPGGVDEGGTASGLGNAGAAPQGSDLDGVLTKRTVLDGYFATGDHECFVFDKHADPYEHSEATDHFMESDDDEVFWKCDECRTYPNDLIPEGADRRRGRWTISVTFVPSPAGSGAEPEEGDQ